MTSAAISKMAADVVGAVKVYVERGIAPLAERLKKMEDAPPVVGERGPQGEPGINGKDGVDGAAGLDGVAGLAGERGEKGDVGEVGPAGKDGEPGKDGERGTDGATGEKGEPGDRGEQGPQGEQGPAGERGEVGPQGEVGPRGEMGPQGQSGEAGPAGEQGIPGEAGPQGEKGERGDDGAAGADGRDGRDGMDGFTPDVNMNVDFARSYPRGTFAAFKSGIWRAGEKTEGMRGWDCLVPGIQDIVQEQDASDPRVYKLRFTMSDGTTKAFAQRLDVPVWRDGYKSGDAVGKSDVVVFGGTAWIARAATSDTPGTGSADWAVFVRKGRDGKDGKDGEKGMKGDRGERGSLT